MRGDFSRVTFRPENHFSGVLLQQGRVQLDAEFNEHVDIEAYRDRATARDVIGRAGAPQDGGGFAISVGSVLLGVGAGTDAWAVGEGGTLLQSVGGTAAWTLQGTSAKTRLNAVDVLDAGGVAVGDGATIVRLSGGVWTADVPPAKVTADLYGVYVDARNAWAVGAAGTVLAWDGTAWQRQAENADVTATLRDVHFAGNTGVAVGDDGTILITTNRGKAWTAQTAPEGSGDLYGVAVVDAKHAWAVGAQGTVLSYNGKAWTAQPVTPGVTSALRAVVFMSATEGSAVGDGGLALRFTSGTWQREATGVDADLLALAALPSGALLAVGESVAIARPAPGPAWAQGPVLPANGRTLTISAGDIYVEGVRCENEHTVSFDRQPEPPLDTAAFPPEAGTYGVFLHVQEQHLTATEREELREVALGGPDTATRTRTVWQAGLAKLSGADPTCADVAAASPQDRPRGRLRARAVPAAVSTSECIVPPNGGYRRLENQLYRVEIHDGTTYVWSRDNGSVIARLEGITTSTADKTAVATVSHTGRDATVGFGPEQIVEITDEGRLLRSQPGVLAQIDSIEGPVLSLSHLDTVPLTMADFPVNPIVRRWDGTGAVESGKWVELEDGVFVEFAEGPDPATAFRTGDYWTIPARTLTGDVVWPLSGGVPRFEERQGPWRHAAPLAIADVDASGVWSGVRDCRKRFPPLTGLVTVDLVGGDGQEAMPGDPLPEPVRVAVRNGSLPVAGARLSAASGTGHLSLSGAPDLASPSTLPDPPGTVETLVTGADGAAEVRWLLDPAGLTTQTLTICRLDDHGDRIDVPVVVTARLSVASQVQWRPACDGFGGTRTVQDALAQLATTAEMRLLGGDGQEVEAPGTVVPQPVRVVVDSPCGPVEGAPVAAVAGDATTGPGFVAAAVVGQPTPSTLDGMGATDKIAVTTGADGVAAFWWQPEFGSGRSATLDLSVSGLPAAPIRVAAELDPPGARRPGVHITRLRFATGKAFLNDSDVAAEDLVAGIMVDLDEPVIQNTVQGKPVVRLELDLPWPLLGEDHEVWAAAPVGYRTVIVDAQINAEGPLIVWGPSARSQDWLTDRMWAALTNGQWEEPVLARFVIEGWAIVAQKDPAKHLNGHADALFSGGRTLFDLPTDDDVTGGRFVQWFRLSRTQIAVPAVAVPDVTRRTAAVAKRIIDAAGLVVSDVVTEPAPLVRGGLVVRTDPPAGTAVDLGTGVVIVVSGGRG